MENRTAKFSAVLNMEGSDFIMAIVITNGKFYVKCSDNGGIRKTPDITKAHMFLTLNEAIKRMRTAPAKTKGYYVQDTLTNRVLWKWMTNEERIQVREQKILQSEVKRHSNGRIKRKQYSQSTRKLIYNKAGGRCELCGRKLLFSDMTLDHVIPLSLGGIDDVENLACVCYADNNFKDNILPEEFNQRITNIFLYQMEKKSGNSIKWKIIHRLLNGMV